MRLWKRFLLAFIFFSGLQTMMLRDAIGFPAGLRFPTVMPIWMDPGGGHPLGSGVDLGGREGFLRDWVSGWVYL